MQQVIVEVQQSKKVIYDFVLITMKAASFLTSVTIYSTILSPFNLWPQYMSSKLSKFSCEFQLTSRHLTLHILHDKGREYSILLSPIINFIVTEEEILYVCSSFGRDSYECIKLCFMEFAILYIISYLKSNLQIFIKGPRLKNISINWKIQMIEQIRTPQFPNHIDEQNSPHEYFCPISRELMHEPVITMDGYSFQRQVIEKWFKQKDKSPITGLKIEKKVIQNRALKQAIKYHNERQSKAYLNAQKLIQTTNTYIKDTIPQLINDIGMLDLDKLITISIENIELKRTLNEIAAQNSKLERRMQSKNNLCQGCSRNISNIIKRAENVIQTSPIINTMNVSAKEFQYLPLSVNQLKRIDFCQLRKENWKLKMFKSYGIQKCSLEILVKRIKNLNKIAENSYTQIWRTSLPINQFYDKIKKELSYQKCTYTRKLLQVGPRIMNTKIQLDELDLKQGQYLVIEHGINNSQQLFRGETVRCQYCYDFKPEKFQCSCETSSYCSQKCAERDRQFHVKQCKLGVNAKLISC